MSRSPSSLPFGWGSLLTQLLAGTPMTEDQAAAVMAEIMEGAATPAQIAAFVVALRAKGETTEEIVGLVRTMRDFSAKVEAGPNLLDTCGTGGDRSGTFNVSTAAAIVCAGAGAKVAKHGNRAASSKAGSADVLEALGVKIDLPPGGVEGCIAEAGIGFCFAPLFHPAMRHTGTTRRELGIGTIFNFLGPLTNPAGATRQALGVSDPTMVVRMVETLGRLGSEHVLAFHGHGGLDELSLSGPSDVLEFRAGALTSYTIDPQELGLRRADPASVAGGTAEENAALVLGVLKGDKGPRRDIVVLNAGAGLVAADIAVDMAAGIARAQESLDSGAAYDSLERLIRVSQS